MRRALMLGMGIGLIILWIAEVQVPGVATGSLTDVQYTHAKAWIVWMDFLFGIMGIFAAAPIILRANQWSMILTVGLTVLSIVGFVSTAPNWMAWSNLGFAVAAALITAFNSRMGPLRPAMPGQKEKDPTKHRSVA